MNLDPARWQRVRELFEAAAELPAQEQVPFLDRNCTKDENAIRTEVMGLLSSLTQVRDPVADAMAGAAAEVVESMGAGLPIGTQLGPYRILQILGMGGMGTVFLAERTDEAFQLRVAVKVVHGGTGNQRSQDRFQAERQILARLDHPNIARVLDGGTTDAGLPYLVMEYVDGTPIDEYVTAKSPGTRERLHLFQSICSAVEHAHRALIVHRDLKPPNVIVTGDGTPKLLDFGIAKLLDPDPAEAGITQPDVRPMTPRYASPEQVRGEPVTTQSDVYALGILLYELLTGQHPYARDEQTTRELEDAILDKDPSAPSGVGSGLDRDLDNIVLRALEKEPARRYPSVAELSADIGRYLGGHPVQARPTTFRYRTAKFVRRHTAGVAAVAVLVVTILAAVLISTTAFLRADRLRIEAEVQRDTLAEVNGFMSGIFEAASAEHRQSPEEVTAREILDAAAARIDSSLAGRPEVAARIRNETGRRYYEIGLFDEAESLHRRALDDQRELEKTEPALLLETLVFLGQTQEARGELEDAVVLLSEAKDIAVREEDRVMTWIVGRSLAQVHKGQGEYEAAYAILAPIYSELADLGEAVRVEGSPESIPELRSSVANDLGNALTRLARFEEGEEYLRTAIDEGERTHGPQHSVVGERLSNLAANLRQQGKQTAAVECSERALKINEAILGQSHPSVTIARLGFADGLVAIGRAEEAEPHHNMVLSAFVEAYGDQHPRVGIAYANRGMGFFRRKELDQARNDMETALRICENSIGADHHVTATIVNNLARVEHAAKHYESAEKHGRASLAVWSAARAESHPDVIRAKALLGMILTETDRMDEAESTLLEAKALADEHLAVDHTVRHMANRAMALWLQKQSRFAEAEPLLLGVYESAAAVEGPGTLSAREAAGVLAELYRVWGQPEKAETYRELSVPVRSTDDTKDS